MKKIIKYVIIDILRNRIMLAFTSVMLLISMTIFNLDDSSSKGLLSLLNIILIVVPMVSILFSAIYIYNSAEFLELLVSQPLRRKTIWLSFFLGLTVSFIISLLISIGVPVLLYEPTSTGAMMLIISLFLSVIFVSIAMLATVKIRDKAKGIGLSILTWLYFSLLFDGLLLFFLFQFSDYPLEKVMVGFTVLNPIDLGRILILLKMDISALMSYTGAIFKNFFGTNLGMIVSFFVLMTWIILPLWISFIKFNRKDL